MRYKFDQFGMVGARCSRVIAWALTFAIASAVGSLANAHGTDEVRSVARAPVIAAPERLSGAIEALVIDDRVDGHLMRFAQLRLADGRGIGLAGSLLDTLSAGDNVVIEGRRNGKVLEISSVVSKLPATAATKNVSERRQIEGMLTIAHADDFEHGIGSYRYDVYTDSGENIRLTVDVLPAVLKGGMRVTVLGTSRSPTSLNPEEIRILAPPPPVRRSADALVAKSTMTHSVLVILANFSDTTAPGYTASQAQAVMTSSAGSVANFVNEASYGQHQLSPVTVTSTWVKLNYAKPATCIDDDLPNFANAANSAALAAGYDASTYDFVIYLFPGGCSWSGLAYIGYPHQSFVNAPSNFQTKVVGHEMGHNFGLLHAGSLRCTNASIATSACSVSEYGDPYSVMGNMHPGHYNALQKAEIGWITTSQVDTHPGGSATYVLGPLETAGAGTYAVEIPTPSPERTYWLEYRLPIGFDAWTGWVSNGVQIRVANPFEFYCSGCDSWSNDTELVDTTPSTSTFNDAALVVGSSYVDPNYPISVNVLSATSTALTVQVVTPGGTSTTTTTIASSPNPANLGSSVTLTATVIGASPTGSVEFDDGGSPIIGCNAVSLAGTGNQRVATCTVSTLSAGSHSIDAEYSGDAANTGSTSAILVQSVTSGWLGYTGGNNTANGSYSAVAAGSNNLATNTGSFVGAGQFNSAEGVSSLVIGGFDNHAMAIDSLVGAGAGNRATGVRSLVVGGGYNLASGQWSFIGGGGRESGSGNAGASTQDNIAGAKWSSVLGGSANRAGSDAAQLGPVVLGGEGNHAYNSDATVAGGALNESIGIQSVIGGGQSNTSSGTATVIGGGSGNAASALASVAIGGKANMAGGNYSLAAGQRAKATASGSIVFADASPFDFITSTGNQFAVRATGGIRIVTGVDAEGGTIAGVMVPAGGGAWTSQSDRSSKFGLTPIDGEAVLDGVAWLSLYSWRYKTESSDARHAGPTAQDFQQAFGLGASDKSIALVDADGVNLAAIQALHSDIMQMDEVIARHRTRLTYLRSQLEMLEASLRALASPRRDLSTSHAALQSRSRKQ